jgi:flagellar assembly factor FliW
MKFFNKRFGELEVDDGEVLSCVSGFPGFEAFRRYALIEFEESRPLVWLLSVENPEIGFVVVNPLLFYPDYAPSLSPDDLSDLEIACPEDLRVYTIITLSPDPRQVTINLYGPIFVNVINKRAKQVALDDDRYSTKHPITR